MASLVPDSINMGLPALTLQVITTRADAMRCQQEALRNIQKIQIAKFTSFYSPAINTLTADIWTNVLGCFGASSTSEDLTAP